MTALNFYLVFLIALFSITGCTTAPKPRMPSEYLLTTDKGSTNVLSDLRTALEDKKYKVKKMDVATGILITHPRKYSFNRAGKQVPARQTLHIRQEGGSVKLRIIYECDYSNAAYEGCLRDDADSNAKINRIEPPLIELIRPLLMKHAGGNSPTSTDAAN